jgi:glycosyltransferase involved in cell wall biosynthesis
MVNIPKYSICICTKNMGDSIERCIESVMRQIDDTFEVIVIDDNSADDTSLVLARLKEKHSLLRYQSLEHDPMRKLGLTRNYSFQIAQGEWCIFHIDADDIIGEKIKDFTIAVEALAKGFQREKLYAGKQIHMARRQFLLDRGPFRNIYRGEDRDFYERLAVDESLVLINHERFISRMERPASKLRRKKIIDVTDQAATDIRKSESLTRFLVDTWKARSTVGLKISGYKFLILVYAFYKAKKLGDLPTTGIDLEEFIAYREAHSKSMSEWCEILNIDYPKQIDPMIFF